jgi:hypothetical protein
MLDFMDGEKDYEGKACEFVNNAKWVKNLGNSLEILCNRCYDYVQGLIKLETGSPEKKKGIDYVKLLKG